MVARKRKNSTKWGLRDYGYKPGGKKKKKKSPFNIAALRKAGLVK
jgi:hypothetical protein